MSEVYILFGGSDYEGATVLGVYTNGYDAMQERDRLIAEKGGNRYLGYDSYYVEEHGVKT